MVVMRKPLLCLLRLHNWQTKHNDEGQAFQECARCGANRETFTLPGFSG